LGRRKEDLSTTILANNGSVAEQVKNHAVRAPQQLAVAGLGARLNYGDLDRRANQLARHLASCGVGSGSLVGLYLRRSPDFIVSALAILKAGAAYLPLDPEAPAERIGFALKDSGAAAVMTSSGLRGQVPGGNWNVVDLHADSAAIAGQSGDDCGVAISPDDLAYVIYTSGSTGQPKGVEITHANLNHLVAWHLRAFEIADNDRASFMAALGFDAAVWEIWPYLAAGASLHIPEERVRTDARSLRDWLVEEKITISFAVTALAESLLGLEWPSGVSLRYLLTGADALRRRPSANLPFTLVNNYGPTEYTVVATSGVVAPAGAGLPSIGCTIDRTVRRVLDENGCEVAPGEAGELYLGGAGLARGYRNQPALTAERFVRKAFGNESADRLYRTGDLVRVRSNGEIEFLGRVDEQVKIRGFRVEPNEIVAALDACPGVSASAVVASEDQEEKRLVAYVVASTEARLTAPGLRQQLLERLPDYMVPAVFVQMHAIPLTLNGKVDRKALPVPETGNTLPEQDYVAPRTLAEQRLAELIAPLLQVERVGVNDNFFLLGGHSLLGAQLINRISDSLGINLPLLSLFDHPTLAGMAEEVERLILEKLEQEKLEREKLGDSAAGSRTRELEPATKSLQGSEG
jgi:amino acid adenylation domain-containing protein